ncbi:unnamed protein product [Heterobilharzia americana]|nr:unnamed protein product [Heterobilharzia americana]
MKRNWNGDVYNALLDCRNAMQLTTQCHTDSSDSPSLQYKSYVNLHGSFNSSVHLTALLLSVRCLLSLDWLSAARIQLKQALDIFPNLLKNTASQKLSEKTFSSSAATTTTCKSSSSKSDVLIKIFERLKAKLLIRERKLESKFINKSETENKQVGEITSSMYDDNNISNDDGQKNSTVSGSGNISEQTSSQSQWDCTDNVENRTDSPNLCACLSCSCDHMLVGDDERERRKNATDYSASYIGHCNSITDIKEANFFGSYGQYIVGGSDCGAFFIWDRNTTNIMRIMKADSSTVNCVQPHPSICLLATSGIDSVIKLWSPNCEEDHEQSRVIKDHVGAAERNQQRVTADPFEIMLVNMGYRIPGLDFDSNRRDSNSSDEDDTNFERSPISESQQLRNETHSGSNHRITSSDDGTFNGEPIQNNMNLINNDTTSTGVSISNKLSHQSSSQTPEQKPSKTVNTTVDEIFFQPPTAASIFDSDSNSSECDSDSNDDTPTGNTTRRQRKTSRRLLSNVNRLRRRILTRRIPFRASFPNEEIATTSWLFDFELNSSDHRQLQVKHYM